MPLFSTSRLLAVPAGEKPSRVVVLDSLRGLASFLVCYYHFVIYFFQRPAGNESHPFGLHGHLGVQMFFVISGFVIPFSLHGSGYTIRSAGRFMLKRLARLHPPYLASIAFTLLVAFVANRVVSGSNYHYAPATVVANSCLAAPLFGLDWLSPAYWTLLVEVQWYLLVALLFGQAGAGCQPRRFLAGALLLCGAACLGRRYFANHWIAPHLPFFVLGLATYRWHAGFDDHRTTTGTCIVAVAAACFGFDVPRAGAAAITTLAILFLRVRIPILNFLGLISYSLYLLHTTIVVHAFRTVKFRGLEPLLGMFGEKLVRLSAGLALAIGLAYLFYRWVEVPSLRWSKSIALRPASPPVPEAGRQIAEP